MNTAMRGIFCFRRDLRIHDNLGLNGLAKICEGGVLPVFCLDPRQLDGNKNKYRSNTSVRFLFESLADLDTQIREACSRSKKPVVGLTVMHGTPEECLPALVKALDCPLITVGWNEDVTPFACERDQRIKQAFIDQYEVKSSPKKNNSGITVDFLTNADDLTVVPVRKLITGTGNKYRVFTPFCRAARAQGVKKPVAFPADDRQFLQLDSSNKPKNIEFMDPQTLLKQPRFKEIAAETAVTDIQGGRSEGLKRITPEFLASHAKHYEVERDFPWQDKTTKLSAFFKFGCISYREAHLAVMERLPPSASAAKEALTREFFWATFYYYVTLNFPHVLQSQKLAFEPNNNNREIARNGDMFTGRYNYNAVWDYSEKAQERLEAWKKGRTGFPFIDAAMRQMNVTGWMHNRARMAVASFLTKDLRVDWREGEKYFAQKLVDYEPSANNGGWQWAGSTGADSQPWFRIFNPWSQSQKHDPNAVYAKKFIPELRNCNPDDIHNWGEKKVRDKYKNDPLASRYPAPIIDHAAERLNTLDVWKKVTGSAEKKEAAAAAAGKKPAAKKTAGNRRARSVTSSDSDDDSTTTTTSSSSSRSTGRKPQNSADRKKTTKQTTLDRWVQ